MESIPFFKITEFKYLTFVKYKKPKKKTYDVNVISSKHYKEHQLINPDILAKIYWYPAWRNYVVNFNNVIFDYKCLNELTLYLNELKKEREADVSV